MAKIIISATYGYVNVLIAGMSRAVPCHDLVDPCRAKYFRAVPCQDLGIRISVPRSWYQDPGTKILVPKKMESPRGGASRYAGGHGGLQAPRQGVWGAGSPPGTAGGPGGGSPPVKTILWYFTENVHGKSSRQKFTADVHGKSSRQMFTAKCSGKRWNP